MSIGYLHGLHWPEWDKKAEQNYNAIIKSIPLLDFAIENCKNRRLAVQAGGHVGLFAGYLAGFFDKVIVFEPHPDLFKCCIRNNPSQRVTVYNAALSNTGEMQAFHQSTSSGSCKVVPDNSLEKTQQVHSTTLDSYGLPGLDFLMLDIEGHELQALQGAEATIRKYSPVIQAEELEFSPAVSQFLAQLHYVPVGEKQGKDRVYLP